MNTKTIKFDLNKYKLYEKIKAKQGDIKSRFLLFQLLDGSIPFNLKNRSVRAYMIKPDGKEIFNDLIVNNYKLGYCTLELTNQVLAVPGTVKIELMITEEERKLTSSIFELEVIKSINKEKSIVSTNEFTALLNGLAALSEYDNYKNAVKEMEETKADKEKVEEKFGEVYEQLDTKAPYCNFVDLLKNNEITDITLIGDSETWGADSTGYNDGDSGVQIWDTWYENNHKCPCFANLFRNYIKNTNSNIKFLNAGVSGQGYKDLYDFRNYWIGKGKDVVFIILGINDGSRSETKEKFIEYVDTCIRYCLDKNNVKHLFICTTPIFTAGQEPSPINGTTINERNEIIRTLAKKYNVPLIDINKESYKIVNEFHIDLEVGDYYYDELTHPWDKGHEVIWLALQRCLGLTDSEGIQVDRHKEFYSYLDLEEGFTFDLKPSETNFYRRKKRICIVLGGNDAVKYKAPSTKGGIMEIINPYNGAVGYIIQKYTTVDNEIYQRTFTLNRVYSEWILLSTNTSPVSGVITYNNNWVEASTTYINSLKKNISNVFLIANLKGGTLASSSDSNVKIMTLPTGFRPSSALSLTGCKSINGVLKSISIFINTDGSVYAQGVTELDAVIILNINFII